MNAVVKVNPNTIRIGDIEIKQDTEGRYCLNDLHRAAGGAVHHRPSEWAKNADSQRFVQELSKDGNPSLVSVKGGAAPGTYATKLAVYKYAGWISPEFEVHVYDTFDKAVTGQLHKEPDWDDPKVLRGKLIDFSQRVETLQEALRLACTRARLRVFAPAR